MLQGGVAALDGALLVQVLGRARIVAEGAVELLESGLTLGAGHGMKRSRATTELSSGIDASIFQYMTLLNDDRDRAGLGGVAPTSFATSAAETAATDLSRVSAPDPQSDRPAEQSSGDVNGDGTAAGAGSAGDAHLRAARERADRYLAELIEEVGEPPPEEVAEAEAWVDRIERALKKARTA